MVLAATTTLALYCSHCGKIHLHTVCRFELHALKTAELCCSCGHVQARVAPARNGQFFLTLYCQLCRKQHVLCVSYRHNGAVEPRKLYCADNNLELGLAGERQLLEQTLDRHRYAVNHASQDPTGAESENSQVLLDVLNKVHDIAENGGVHCSCGSSAIRARVLTACIELRCLACGAAATLAARNETDLARLADMKTIDLSRSCHSRTH
ncbi:MAG: hypothetical protein E6X17_11235 [Sporomusaceae bacterium]|nr:hypothetical protein [Sporomusaceae bacterium]